MLVQPLGGFTKTYAAPAPLCANSAPTATVSLLIETLYPKASPSAPSLALSLAVSVMSVHPVGGLTNTYAAPGPCCWGVWKSKLEAFAAPTMIVSPLIATDVPNPAPPSEDVRKAVLATFTPPP